MKEVVVAGLIALLVLTIGACAYYHQTGWNDFSFREKQTVVFPAPRGIGRLRFKSATFQVLTPAGPVAWDVTAVLNGIAGAHASVESSADHLTLAAGIPLNPFSFKKVGFNDRATVPSAAEARAWEGRVVQLSGKIRTL